jgi:GNAT superfamily N-acetyltransferase
LFVPVIDGRVVGFAHAGPERIDGNGPNTGTATGLGEVYGFYLHPQAWGSGAAGPLMEACVAHLAIGGFGDLCLWVLRDNGRARAFYEKAGWCWSGRELPWSPSDAPDLTVVETRYERSLAVP